MGWSFRKSLNLGPFRLTFSKSGMSYSVGAGGVRIGQSAKKRKYVSLNVPGTGLSYKKFFKSQ